MKVYKFGAIFTDKVTDDPPLMHLPFVAEGADYLRFDGGKPRAIASYALNQMLFSGSALWYTCEVSLLEGNDGMDKAWKVRAAIMIDDDMMERIAAGPPDAGALGEAWRRVEA